MKAEDAVERLRALRDEAATLPPSTGSAEFNSWKPRLRSVLTRALGESHHITQRFIAIKWTPSVYALGDTAAFTGTFRATVPEAQGVIDAAIAELELLAEEVPVADESGVDAELWEHIAPEVAAEAWGKVASQAVIFTEDRIRRWAGRPASEVGRDLAVAVFGKSAQFQMGQTEGENQGWQLYAQGIVQACATWMLTASRKGLITSDTPWGWSAPARCCSLRCASSMAIGSGTPLQRLPKCPTRELRDRPAISVSVTRSRATRAGRPSATTRVSVTGFDASPAREDADRRG